MPKLVNRAKMTTATTGTGTLTLGSALAGYQTFANAGVANSDIVRYTIEDGSAWEIGLGTYSSTGTTLTRGTIESSTGTAINLSGNATVFVTAAASDLQELVTFAETFALPTADGTNGQVLTTNGTGTLTFQSAGGVSLTGQTDSASPFETSLGSGAGAVNTGVNNTFIGFEAGNDNTTGTDNTAVGYQSADAMTTGGYNAAFGVSALGGMTTGFRNVAVGAFAGASLTGSDNIVVGPFAYDAATLGSQNVAIGRDAMGVTTSNVSGNVAVGYKALEDVASDYNVAVGWSAGLNITSGAENVAIGYQSLDANTTGLRNVGIGSNALGALTTGSNNVAIGNGALDAATTGGQNIAIGQDAMGSGVATAASGYNVAISKSALQELTTGTNNIAIGLNAMLSATTASSNVVLGSSAGRPLTTGTQNVIIGESAAFGIPLTTGSNNIVIGRNAGPSATDISNEITLGSSSITTLRCQVTTITSLSDARDKADIQPINAGLEFVEALNPVSFTWNMRDGGKVGEADTGFIAQDLQMAQEWAGVTIPGLVYDVNPDKLEAGYGKLIPVLVQAIKDLSEKVKDLEAKLEAQK